MHAAATRAMRLREPLLSPQARAGLGSPTFRWSVAPALVAWLALLWLAGETGVPELCVGPRTSLAEGLVGGIAATLSAIDPLRWAAEWAVMIVGMMFPLLAPAVGHVVARSFAARRDRSIMMFVLGYGLVWLGAAAAASLWLVIIRGALAALGLAAASGLIGGALAALWQLSAAKARAVKRCHGTIALRAFGAAADRDAARFGLIHGVRCVRACAPTMVLPIIGGHGIGLMAALFAILLAERARETPQYGLSAIALVLLGLTTLT